MVSLYYLFNSVFIIKKDRSFLMDYNLLDCDSCFLTSLKNGLETVSFIHYDFGEKQDLHSSLNIALKQVTEQREQDALAGIEQKESYYHNYLDRLIENLIKGYYVRGYKHFLLFLN